MDMEEKKLETNTEQNLPVQELPSDIPAEVRQKLAEDLNEEATEDLKQDMREAEREEANDEEVKANPEMLTKSRLLKLLIKKQYVKLREVTEEEQPADRSCRVRSGARCSGYGSSTCPVPRKCG